MYETMLMLPNISKPFEVHYDSYEDCLGMAVLMKEGHAIPYRSYKLHPKEKILGLYEKELQKHYLLGTPFIIQIDHYTINTL